MFSINLLKSASHPLNLSLTASPIIDSEADLIMLQLNGLFGDLLEQISLSHPNKKVPKMSLNSHSQ